MRPEAALRAFVTIGLVGCLGGFALSLGARPTLVFGLGTALFLIPTIWLWKRWGEQNDRALETPKVDSPHRPKQTAEAQFAARSERPRDDPDEDGPSYGP